MFFFHYSLLYVPCIVTVAIFYEIGISQENMGVRAAFLITGIALFPKMK